MSHRATDDTAVAAPAPRRYRFQERYAPHYGMAAVTAAYGAFYATVGAAAVPQTITLGFTGTVSLWFGFLIQQSRKDKGDT